MLKFVRAHLMRQLRLLLSLTLLIAGTTFAHAEMTVQRTSDGELERAIVGVQNVVDPLVAGPESGHPKQRICKTCTPANVSHWRAPKFYQIGDGRTETGRAFLKNIRVIVRAAACDANTTALREIHALSEKIEGAILTEPEALLLEHRAQSRGLSIPFRAIARRKSKQVQDTVEDWPAVTKLKVELRTGDVESAIRSLKSIRELCR